MMVMSKERVLVCPKCARELVVYQPSARAWHESCPNRKHRGSAPEYREKRQDDE